MENGEWRCKHFGQSNSVTIPHLPLPFSILHSPKKISPASQQDINSYRVLTWPHNDIFFDVRKVPGLKKKPSTSELIDWLKLLMADDIPDEILTNRDPSKAIPPLYGALVKNEQDVHLLERLAFMNRRDSRG